MNLFNFFNKPEELHGYQDAIAVVPSLLEEHIRDNKELTEKQKRVLANSPSMMTYYAMHRRERFKPGEKILLKDSISLIKYMQHAEFKERWPEAEHLFFNTKIASRHLYKFANFYMRNIVKGEWPEYADYILKQIYNKEQMEEFPIDFEEYDVYDEKDIEKYKRDHGDYYGDVHEFMEQMEDKFNYALYYNALLRRNGFSVDKLLHAKNGEVIQFVNR